MPANRPEVCVGVDIGGTKVLGGAVDRDRVCRTRRRVQTPGPGHSSVNVEDAVVMLVDDLRAAFDVVAVGVGAAGFVDLGGTVRFAPHVAWRDEALGPALSRRLGVSVVVDNDANTAARAEMHFGAGRGAREAVCITLGTGIGGAVVHHGEVARGWQGMAGEFGHMPIVPGGRSCPCGLEGCWERYCSGTALLRAAREAGGHPASGPDITMAAQAGEQWALSAYGEVGRWLGIGLSGLVAALDPAVVVVGGGVSQAGDLLLGPARTALAERLPGRGYRAIPPLRGAELGVEAGFLGAADLAWSSFDGVSGRV